VPDPEHEELAAIAAAFAQIARTPREAAAAEAPSRWRTTGRLEALR
jgi:hypothetical protein